MASRCSIFGVYSPGCSPTRITVQMRKISAGDCSFARLFVESSRLEAFVQSGTVCSINFNFISEIFLLQLNNKIFFIGKRRFIRYRCTREKNEVRSSSAQTHLAMKGQTRTRNIQTYKLNGTKIISLNIMNIFIFWMIFVKKKNSKKRKL